MSALPLIEGSDDHFYGAWKGGSAASGGGPAARPSGEVVADFKKGMAAFEEGGGHLNLTSIRGFRNVEAVTGRLNGMKSTLGDQWWTTDGTHETFLAVNDGDGRIEGMTVWVATGPVGGIAGAMSMRSKAGTKTIDIWNAGSTGIVKGMGSKFSAEAIRKAARARKGLTLDALPGAVTFWHRVGFTNGPPGNAPHLTHMEMPYERVKEIARLLG